MTRQRQSSHDSHALRAANAPHDSDRDFGPREYRGGERAGREPHEPEIPAGILAELQWGREG